MSSKQNSPTSPGTNPQTLKIGSRVRCTDDGVEGRIVWANAVSVKIRWDDGEQVTWRRDSLAGRPIEILAESSEEQTVAPTTCEPSVPVGVQQTDQEAVAAAPEAEEGCATPEQPDAEQPAEPTAAPAPAEQPADVLSATPIELQEVDSLKQARAEGAQAEMTPPTATAQETSTPPEHTAGQPEATSTAAKKPRARKPKDAGEGKEKRLSALDAAAKVL